MGNEYYFVKPSKREIFELGKHIQPFEGINSYPSQPNWAQYDYFQEFFLDMIETNGSILDGSYTYEEIVDFAYGLYEWIKEDKVYLDSDCHDNAEWENFEVTGSVYDYCENNPSLLSSLETLIETEIPEEYYETKHGNFDIVKTLERFIKR